MFCRRYFAWTVAIFVAAAPTLVRADVIAYEGFAYSAGSLDGDNGGTGWANAWSASSSGSASVSAAGLTYASGGKSLVTSGGSVSLPGDHYGGFRSPASVPTSGSMYISFLADRTGDGESNYLGLSLFSGGAEQAIFGAMNGETHWGIEQNTTGATYMTTETVGATPTLLVARIDFGASDDTVSLYVNPSLTAEPSTPSVSATFNTFSWDRIRIQSRVAGNVDEIRIGTTYADVTQSVPEPGVCVFAVTGFISLLAYAWRRQTSHA